MAEALGGFLPFCMPGLSSQALSQQKPFFYPFGVVERILCSKPCVIFIYFCCLARSCRRGLSAPSKNGVDNDLLACVISVRSKKTRSHIDSNLDSNGLPSREAESANGDITNRASVKLQRHLKMKRGLGPNGVELQPCHF